MKNEPIEFKVYGNGYNIVFKDNKMIVGGIEFDKSTVKDFKFYDGKFIITHVNHQSKLLGLYQQGYKIIIPFSEIANNKLFILFFKYFVSNF